ncbi:interleukin-20 receptor subunit alpha [Eucyclogobius newberryi]|uniref:interleukin-20 receptor subunit alpha n=1 Tax=Eucyclogobius newberryi TaxID=166745 RepID=UPI003B5AB2FA
MGTSLFLVLVSCTAVLSSPPKPVNVTFASENLRNILLWSPGHGAPAETKYSVRYAIYGDSLGLEKRVHWRPVLHCTDISRFWCDLSVETSDLEQGYFAKVRAVSRKGNSKWTGTHRRFDPIIDTDFGPPHVTVEVVDKHVVIKMEGPMRFLPRNHTTQVSMATLDGHMTYNLSIKNTRSGMIHSFALTSDQFKYRFLDHGTKYCFSANTKTEHRFHESSKHRPSPWNCIATPEVSLIDRLEKMVLISTTVPVLLLCLLGAGGYVLHKYLSGKDQKSPYILTQPAFLPPPLQKTPDSFNMIVIAMTTDDVSLNKLYPKLPNTPILTLGEGYKKKEWQIEAISSGTSYASQTSSLQTSSASAAEPMSLNNSGNNQQGLRRASESPSVISSAGYASQIAQPAEPTHQADDLPSDYGFVTAAVEEEAADLCPQEPEDEDTGFLHLNWSPTSPTLLMPGFDVGMGQREVGGRPNLETVFVRQPSEEDALLGGERSPSGQWDPEEFMAKWDLIVSNE